MADQTLWPPEPDILSERPATKWPLPQTDIGIAAEIYAIMQQAPRSLRRDWELEALEGHTEACWDGGSGNE
jgi:hypothetical protein